METGFAKVISIVPRRRAHGFGPYRQRKQRLGGDLKWMGWLDAVQSMGVVMPVADLRVWFDNGYSAIQVHDFYYAELNRIIFKDVKGAL